MPKRTPIAMRSASGMATLAVLALALAHASSASAWSLGGGGAKAKAAAEQPAAQQPGAIADGADAAAEAFASITLDSAAEDEAGGAEGSAAAAAGGGGGAKPVIRTVSWSPRAMLWSSFMTTEGAAADARMAGVSPPGAALCAGTCCRCRFAARLPRCDAAWPSHD